MNRHSRPRTLELLVLGVRVHIVSASASIRRLVLENFGCMRRAASAAPADLEYRVLREPGGYVISGSEETSTAADSYELIYDLEKRLTIDLQLRRKELLFVHAAALELDGSAYLLAAPPGSGKSTTAWAMVNQGFGYLSDELAPIDLATMQVLPYPHAICLKAPPPEPYGLPERVVRTSRTLHVPAAFIPRVVHEPVPLAGVIFNTYDALAPGPSLLPVSAGVAGARLYANALNHLAHPNAGLASVSRVMRVAAAYALITNRDLHGCARLLKGALGQKPESNADGGQSRGKVINASSSSCVSVTITS